MIGAFRLSTKLLSLFLLGIAPRTGWRHSGIPSKHEKIDHGEDFGVRQVLDDERPEELYLILRTTRLYLNSRLSNDGDDDCRNKHELCTVWARIGECKNNAPYMIEMCAPVCEACEFSLLGIQSATAAIDHAFEFGFDRGLDFGVGQDLDLERFDEAMAIMETTRQYLKFRTDRELCRNSDKECVNWAMDGACQTNERFMNVTCTPVCQACDDRVTHVMKCHHNDDPTATDTWFPGDLDRMFEQILAEQSNYGVTVLSRPYMASGDTQESATYQLGPWLVTLDQFLTDEESDHLTALGESEGYTRLRVSASDLQHTGSNVYCRSEHCFNDTVHQAIRQRMADITSIPVQNYEHFQMIRYYSGEWFEVHNDFAPSHIFHPSGVRIITFLVYHSHVEEGGGTQFPPPINMTVMPQKGRALIFPCVLSAEPNQVDERMDHAGLPVIKGVKYAINTHADQRDYMGPINRDCLLE